MIDIAALGEAFSVVFSSWYLLGWIVAGLVVGLVFGAIPGLSSPIGMAVFLPLTIFIDLLPALLFLTSIFTGAGYASAIPAVLFNVPGTPSAIATCFDGYPMTRQGRHNYALGLSLGASCFASALAYILLLFLIEPLGRVVLMLGPIEMLAIVLWAMTLIAALSGKAVNRGLAAGALGLMLGTIGMSADGQIRGTLGTPFLLDGVPILPTLVGLFVSLELFSLLGKDYVVESREARRVKLGEIFRGVRETPRYLSQLLRGSLFGAGIGALPGVGSAVANLVSYNNARSRSHEPETYGRGNPAGLVAAESANNSSEGGSMTTLLALGIPGGAGTAVLLGALASQGVVGGPRLMAQERELIYQLIVGNLLEVIILVGLGVGFCFVASAALKIPARYLVPSIVVLACLGSYASAGNMSGPIAFALATVAGWAMNKYGFSVIALAVGLLLGRLAEGNLLRTYQLSGGDPLFLTGRPIAMGILAVMVATLIWGPIQRRRRQNR